MRRCGHRPPHAANEPRRALTPAPAAASLALPVGFRLHEYRIDGVLGPGRLRHRLRRHRREPQREGRDQGIPARGLRLPRASTTRCRRATTTDQEFYQSGPGQLPRRGAHARHLPPSAHRARGALLRGEPAPRTWCSSTSAASRSRSWRKKRSDTSTRRRSWRCSRRSSTAWRSCTTPATCTATSSPTTSTCATRTAASCCSTSARARQTAIEKPRDRHGRHARLRPDRAVRGRRAPGPVDRHLRDGRHALLARHRQEAARRARAPGRPGSAAPRRDRSARASTARSSCARSTGRSRCTRATARRTSRSSAPRSSPRTPGRWGCRRRCGAATRTDSAPRAASSWAISLRSPRCSRASASPAARAVARPASWPIAVKMTLAMVATALLPMIITAYYNLNADAGARGRRWSCATSSSSRRAPPGASRSCIGDSRNLADYVGTDDDFVRLPAKPHDEGHARDRSQARGPGASAQPRHPVRDGDGHRRQRDRRDRSAT